MQMVVTNARLREHLPVPETTRASRLFDGHAFPAAPARGDGPAYRRRHQANTENGNRAPQTCGILNEALANCAIGVGVYQSLFLTLDLQRHVFRVDARLRQASGDEPDAILRCPLEHI